MIDRRPRCRKVRVAMTYFKVTYQGPDRNEGRFGNVTKGVELLLTKHEYKCVAEDPHFEFVEEITVEAAPIPGNTTRDVAKSPGHPGEVKEPGRATAGPGTDHAPDPDLVEVVRLPEVEEVVEEDWEEEVPPYSAWKKSELVEEIEARNEGREPDLMISTVGTKLDLVNRLYADDE